MYGLQNCVFEGLFYMYMYIYMCKVNILNSSQIVVFYAGGAELSQGDGLEGQLVQRLHRNLSP